MIVCVGPGDRIDKFYKSDLLGAGSVPMVPNEVTFGWYYNSYCSSDDKKLIFDFAQTLTFLQKVHLKSGSLFSSVQFSHFQVYLSLISEEVSFDDTFVYSDAHNDLSSESEILKYIFSALSSFQPQIVHVYLGNLLTVPGHH